VFQHELRPPAGSRRKRKRVGRGNASGHGTYSGRGLKGQKARSGGGVRLGFEGGQLPLVRRMARKRGFTNIFRVEYAPVNVSRLAQFPAGSEVTPDVLLQAGVVKNRSRPVKILGNGGLEVALTVRAHKFSASARKRIEDAGGVAEEVSGW
jgi:large subunit ribosomal protein L15